MLSAFRFFCSGVSSFWNLRSYREGAMKKALLYSLFVLVFISGCGANSAPAPIAVTLSTGATQALDQGQSVAITATVANDSTAKGVTWSLASGGQGTIANQTTTAVTYNAGSASGTAVITATSVTDTTKISTLTITVTAPPAITTTTLPPGTEGTAYSQAIAKTGGAGTVTFSISAGALPTGLTLSGAGTISGTPAGPNGTVNFTVKVTDSSTMTPMTATQALSIVINLPAPPTITTTTLPPGVAGTAYSQMVAATGFGTLTFTTSAGAVPSGLTLSSAGLISGTPDAPNVTSNFTVMVTDSSNPAQTATQALSILINLPPPPTITSLSQNAGAVGASITITGTNFGTAQGSSTVTFNGNTAAAASAWSATSITVLVPAGATTGNVVVTVFGVASNGSPFTIVLPPTITILSQISGAEGASVTITGTNFGTLQGTSTVTFNGTAAAAASAWSATSITVLVPVGATTGNVVVNVLGTASNGSPFTVAPTITSLSQTSGAVGASIAITGTNFGTTQGTSTITFNGITATAASAWSATSITVSVPAGATTGNVVVTVLGTASNGSAFTVLASCTTNCSLSGTVTGPWVANVTISLTGTATLSTTTAANGTYSFANLAAGSYTITPTLAGYNYTPTPPTIAISSNTVQNFVATPVMTSYSISGKVSYSGTQTGTTIIRVIPSGCTGGCNIVAGTSFPNAPSSSGTPYTVRGLQPAGSGGNANGSYIVTAEIDPTPGTGEPNSSDPTGSTSTITISAADVTGQDFSINDRTPPLAMTPTQLNISPGSQMALVMYKAPKDTNGEEIATSYTIFIGTDVNASNGTPVTFPAHGTHDNNYIFHGITNGIYYFKILAHNVNGDSAPSAVVGPVTVGPTTGANMVSGTVTFLGAATGPLYVGVFDNNTGTIYVQTIASPVSPQTYSVSGVPNGTYQNFAIIDMNNDGLIGVGDLQNVNNNNSGPQVTVNGGNVTGSMTLSSATMTVNVATNHQQFSGSSYNLSLRVNWGTKRPVSVTLFSGPN